MGDWAQVAPDQATAIKLMTRHAMSEHMAEGCATPQWVIDRCDAKLTHCPYVPPDGRYVGDR